MAVFTNNTPASDYGCILNVGVTNGQVGLTNVLQQIQDAYGNPTPCSISTIAFNISRTGYTFSLDSVAITAQAVDINSMCQPNPIALGNEYFIPPVGTTSQRDPSPVQGEFRFNSTTGLFEGYNGSAWINFETSGGSGVTSVSGDALTILATPTTGSVVVSILDTYIGQTSITHLGTVIVGQWEASTITTPNGGSGVSSPTAHGILIAEGSSAFNAIVLSAGQILIGTTSGDPTAAAINSGTGILVGNASGSITIANTGVTSIIETANQITASATTGAVTLTIPATFIAPGSIAATTTVSGTTFNSSTLTASTALATDSSKNIVSSVTTATELGYVSGVTSAIQTQLNAKGTGTVTSIVAGTNLTGGTITNTGTIALSTTPTGLTSIGVGTFTISSDVIASSAAINISPGSIADGIGLEGNTYTGSGSLLGGYETENEYNYSFNPSALTASTNYTMPATLPAGNNYVLESSSVGAWGWLAPTGTGNNVLATSPTITTPNIVGVTNASNAAAGSVGEVISSSVLSSSAVNITTSTATDMTSISLTAGDWDVYGNINFVATISITQATAWISTTSSTYPGNSFAAGSAIVTGVFTSFGPTVPIMRINVNTTTTVYISGYVAFTSGSCSMCGNIFARRAR